MISSAASLRPGGQALCRAIDVGADKGKIENAVVEPNAVTGGWRLSFQLVQGSEKLVELHARLMDGETPLTETWIYRWTA